MVDNESKDSKQGDKVKQKSNAHPPREHDNSADQILVENSVDQPTTQ